VSRAKRSRSSLTPSMRTPRYRGASRCRRAARCSRCANVRAVRDGRVSLVVVEHTTTVKLTARSARLRDFYPMGPKAATVPKAPTVSKAPTGPKKGDRDSVNERTGLRKGQGPACTGTGCDRWWIVNPVLVEWLKARTRWFRE
jgi:hypothetical protein